MEEFLAYAASNTKRGIESCGILAGRLQANDSIFNITTLIIPKQSGTSDTVQALNEEEIFDVQVRLVSYSELRIERAGRALHALHLLTEKCKKISLFCSVVCENLCLLLL